MPIKNKILSILIAEKDSLFLWTPVLFGIGIVTYFKLPFEPDLKISITAAILLIIGIILFNKVKTVLWLNIISLIFCFGFLSANIRSVTANAPSLKWETGIRNITGTIESISSKPHGSRFLLKSPKIEGLPQDKTPIKIRINIKTDHKGASIGDTISVLASLSPPPKPVIPGGYDFSRYAYFKQIGAVGYAVSDVKIISSPKELPFVKLIEKTRHAIKEKILEHSDKTNAHIATALIIGEKGGIDNTTIENVRVSGIAHILAISGMHLSLVAAIFFFMSRFIMSLFNKIALNYNIKKYAALIAIIGSFCYLLISGSPISAQRAFIMTSLILLAIMIDRSGTPMRSVALAALLILIFSPESILTPSFQMSFAAVFALISMYELMKPLLINYSEYGVFKKITVYLFGIVFSSAVAGVATSPFAIYHFNNFAPYGIITNLFVVPLTSLFVMPMAVITMLLMPVGLEQVGLRPMLFGVDLILKTANYIASLPQPVGMIKQIPDLALAIITMGGVIFLILKTKIRYWGLAIIAIGITFSLNNKIPNIIIGGDAKLIALKTEEDTLAFSSNVYERYSKNQWQKQYAIKESVNFTNVDNNIIKCDSIRCHYKNKGYFTSIVKHPLALEEDCSHADIIINLTYINLSCKKPKLVVNKQDIRKNGTHTIYIDKNNYKVSSVKSQMDNRIWQ
jgi:competence protein ComEC